MDQVRPFEEIPVITLPDDYQTRMGEFLAEMYVQHGPIFRYYSEMRQADVVMLVGPEANRLVMVSERQKFSHWLGWGQAFGIDQLFGRGLLTMDGSEHDHHRKIMNPAFTLNYMERYLPLMHRVIRQRVAEWAESEVVDVYAEARKITFDIAASALTGLDSAEEVAMFRKLFVALLSDPEGVTTEEEYLAYITPLQQQLYTLLLAKIEERRQHPTDDVFGLLVQAKDEQGHELSIEQLIAHINILLVAGHETSTSLSAWLLYLLTLHPDYTSRVLEEQAALLKPEAEPTLEDIKRMKVLENALSEAERLYPPVPVGPRGAVEDFVLNGYHVPADTLVFYSIAASHRLPDIFANPTEFDPDRFAPPREEHKKHPYSLVGFGGGPRICIGINFAQVEIKALASHVLRNYELTLAPDQEIVPLFSATIMPMHGIQMSVRPKVASVQ